MDRLLVLPLLVGLLVLVFVNGGCPPNNQGRILSNTCENNSHYTYVLHVGMYLMHKGVCYLNGSYFFDADIKSMSNRVSCILPSIILGDGDDGEWVTPNELSVVCPTSTGFLHCIISSLPGDDTTFSLYRPSGQSPPAIDGWYKCCLPTNCSDPNTNIIFANIFSKIYVLAFLSFY